MWTRHMKSLNFSLKTEHIIRENVNRMQEYTVINMSSSASPDDYVSLAQEIAVASLSGFLHTTDEGSSLQKQLLLYFSSLNISCSVSERTCLSPPLPDRVLFHRADVPSLILPVFPLLWQQLFFYYKHCCKPIAKIILCAHAGKELDTSLGVTGCIYLCLICWTNRPSTDEARVWSAHSNTRTKR